MIVIIITKRPKRVVWSFARFVATHPVQLVQQRLLRRAFGRAAMMNSDKTKVISWSKTCEAWGIGAIRTNIVVAHQPFALEASGRIFLRPRGAPIGMPKTRGQLCRFYLPQFGRVGSHPPFQLHGIPGNLGPFLFIICFVIYVEVEGAKMPGPKVCIFRFLRQLSMVLSRPPGVTANSLLRGVLDISFLKSVCVPKVMKPFERKS
ncbi:hypothetical protein TbgDal_XI7660 [Trypanosoma brucei gambiense DAL972]|uniref:Uncharacterized protein n=1 Tax=Trypanosoma brucei gambiense (strain MHOM/CI/86/DAL972) TaxID=679716 RepID=D0A7J6_TRYB9|nr:hypothetical protein TbgDal_XI7660 [Trypanosoma brucei gambiense DAL972]CBH17647.1 hypothetical protein TbgDal_XI7660 [Trypanosoma brucei gambiense DAL972]|eukprot:XP_011779911.1 hypothetical protein TbgDal_XI7660 [Trypanosoma brucei gambiense DAL972]